ncbi:MAG: M48 family metalloprotease [Pseudomonadota bacterium]
MHRISTLRRWLSAAALAPLLVGCVTNPVTGKSEISIVSAAQELQIGQQNYLPMQQSQGGEFRLDPSVGQYVAEIGNRIALKSPRDLPYEFVVLNNSVPNAWALPGGKIAINRGLLTRMSSEAELAAVLGHEIVHAAAKHSAKQIQRGMLLQALVVGTAVVTSDSDYGNLAAGAANIGAQLLNQSYSRKAELESDFYGMQYMAAAGYDPQGAVDLQETFLRLSQESGRSSGPNLLASHPPSQQRLATNNITADELRASGQAGDLVGRDNYRSRLRKLLDATPAYNAYDEGRKALAAKDYATANAKARQAISLEPREASFYALLGDVALLQDNTGTAINEYTRALDRDATFFYYHLQRGLARKRAGQTTAAERDLQASLKLFQTGPAMLALGEISAGRNDLDNARRYFTAAAGAPGQSGQAAQAALMRMDFARNPGAFLQVRSGTDGNGQLLIAINNPNPLAVRNIQVRIRYLDSEGRTRDVSRRFNGTLAAQQNTTVATGLGPFQSAQQFDVQLTGAALAE